jgi:hypothetical protein
LESARSAITTPAGFTLAIVAAYVFIHLAGSLLLIGGITIYKLASGDRLPGPGFVPLMISRPYGADMMYPMMIFGSPQLTLSSLLGILAAVVIITSGLLLYLYPKHQIIWGSIVVTSSIIGFLSGGGFFIGSIVGIVGGIIAISVKIR